MYCAFFLEWWILFPTYLAWEVQVESVWSMCLNAEKQLQAIDSVSLTLVLMPVGKASGIPVRVILKGIQCVCVVWCVCVCVCLCVWVGGGGACGCAGV